MWRSARIAINADGRRCRASQLRREHRHNLFYGGIDWPTDTRVVATVANCGASEVGPSSSNSLLASAKQRGLITKDWEI